MTSSPTPAPSTTGRALLAALEALGPTPALAWYGEASRIELSGHVLANWVIKAIGHLHDEVALEHGDTVVLDLAPHWKRLVLALATWSLGGEVVLLPRTRLQPDTRHRFVLDGEAGVSSVRLDVFPDGGMARLRLWGRPTSTGRAALGRRWFDALPDVPALEVLGSLGVDPSEAGRLVGHRPLTGELPPAVRTLLDGPAG